MALRAKAVFLDRDGVINLTVFRKGAHRAPADLSEFAYVSGLEPTLEALKSRGYVLIVCTNQPDVARGWQPRARRMRERSTRIHNPGWRNPEL